MLGSLLVATVVYLLLTLGGIALAGSGLYWLLRTFGVLREDRRCRTCGASVASPLTARRVPGYPLCARCGAVTSLTPSN